MRITTGFLDGNLNDTVMAEAYASALRRAIMGVFPSAKVVVHYQAGEGSKPYDLQTRVESGGFIPDEYAQSVVERVDRIAREVHETGAF